MNEIVNTAALFNGRVKHHTYEICIGKVISNDDKTNQGRVHVHLPNYPNFKPWARVAVPMAGKNRGTYFIPQEDDEVLIVFNRGDIKDAFVVGSVWNGIDPPPATSSNDPINKCVVRTPQGHEIELDDAQESITVTSLGGHKVTIDPSGIELETSGGGAKVTLDDQGSKVSVEATNSISLKASNITIEGKSISIKGSSSVQIQGGQICTVQAGTVKIN